MASSRVAMPWIAGALVAGVLAGGLPLWPMSYGEVAILTSPLPMWWAVAVSIAAVGVSYASPLGIVRSAVVVALGVPVAVALRVGGGPNDAHPVAA